MWLFIAIVGYIILGIVGILDKFILSKSVPRPAVFVFYSSIFVLPILLLVPFGLQWIVGARDWLIAAVAGVTFALALWTMYKGFLVSEVSHVGPLVGAATPFFVLLLNPFWQKEILSNIDLIAIVVLIIGSLVISFEQSKQHHGWHLGMAWGVLAGLFFALSNLASKYIYDGYGFYSGLVWTRGMLGVCGILLLAAPTVRAVVFKKKKKIKIPMRSGVSRLFLVGTDKILGVVGVVMIQFAIATGSVTIVNALNGLQYAALVVMVALLSKFSPRLFHEDYAPAEIWQEIFAIVLIAVGLGLLIK
jgi:drug/metabolite transporter (DMT)-like permease